MGDFDLFSKGGKYIKDWKGLLMTFQRSIGDMSEALPQGTVTAASQIITLGQLLTKNAGNKILLNIHISAMHLADILGGVGPSNTRAFPLN